MTLKELWPMIYEDAKLLLTEKAEGTHIRLIGCLAKTAVPMPDMVRFMDRNVYKIGHDKFLKTEYVLITLDDPAENTVQAGWEQYPRADI